MRFPEFTGEWHSYQIHELGKMYNGLSRKNSSDFGKGLPYITYKSIFDNCRIDISRVEFVEITQKELNEGLQHKVKKGDVFFTTSSETAEEVGMVSVLLDDIENCFLNSFCFGFRLNSFNEVSPNYLQFYLRSNIIRKKMNILAQGSTRFNISKNEVLKMKIKLPRVKEQRHIAYFLEILEKRIQTQIRIIDKLESLIKGIRQHLFGQTKGKTIPLSQLCNIQKGQQVNREELTETGKYYVMNGGIMPSGYYGKYNAEANTISISEGGSCGYVQFNDCRFWSSGHCYTLTDIIGSISNLYLFHYLKFKEQDIMALRIGSGIPNIQKKDIAKFQVLVLSKKQQEQITNLLQSITTKIKVEKDYLANLSQQKQYLLQNLFI